MLENGEDCVIRDLRFVLLLCAALYGTQKFVSVLTAARHWTFVSVLTAARHWTLS